MTDSRDAIRDLMMHYARLSDRGDYDAVGELFEHGPFRSTLGAALGGAELAANRKQRILSHDGKPGTRHLTTNVMIDVDEDAGTARARSYYTLLQATPAMPLRVVGCGRYYDRLERVDGEWRFADRLSLLDTRGDLSQHVAGFRPGELPYDVNASGPPLEELPPMPVPEDAHAAVETLIFTYAERVDLGDFEGAGEVFAHGERRFGPEGTPLGGPALAEALRSSFRMHDGSPRTKHVTTNMLIDVDEEAGTATARSYFTVPQATRELPLQLIAAGRYHDAFERVDGVWRFRSRVILLDHQGEIGQHLSANAALHR